MKLIINKQSTNYSVTFSAQGFDSEEITISHDQVRQLREGIQFLDSRLNHHQPQRFVSDFADIGSDLYRVFFSPFKQINDWFSQAQLSPMPSFITIETTDHDVSTLAWELLYRHESHELGFLGASPHFQIIRTAGTDGVPDRPFTPGPLRVLFMTSSPEGTEPLLYYEKEEEIILDAVSELKRKKGLDIDIAETGTLEELKDLLKQGDYHVVHLSGHGHYNEMKNTGYLSMERESGAMRPVSAQELADALFGCPSLRLLFLSSCQSGMETEPNTGLARLLVSQGIPMVIGMRHSIRDSAAMEMSKTFYQNLAAKKTVSFSLKMARRDYAHTQNKRNTFQWIIPALFSHNEDTDLVDWNKPLTPAQKKEPPAILYGRKIKHLNVGFRGRRRQLREHLKMLRQGQPPALCITGSGGIGKSTLASKLTDRLRHSGYMVIPLFGEITPDRFIQATLKALVAHREREHLDYIKELIDYNDKIDYILSNVLETRDTIYFFDNFEDNLKQSAHFKEFKNPFWEQSFQYIVEMLPDTSSRIIITCRYTIPDIPHDLIHHAPLKEMSEPETRKLIVFNKDYMGIDKDHFEEHIKEVAHMCFKVKSDHRSFLKYP